MMLDHCITKSGVRIFRFVNALWTKNNWTVFWSLLRKGFIFAKAHPEPESLTLVWPSFGL